MTITLLCSTPNQAFEIERELIDSDHEIEILNPYHEDPVIYASRTPDPDCMVRRAIVTLICRGDQVLNLSGQTWVNDICKIVGVPVSTEYAQDEPIIVEATPDIEELWCGGCQISKMQPLHVSVDGCKAQSNSCPLYKNFDEAFNGVAKYE